MQIFVHASWIISMLEMLSHQKRKKKKQTIVLEPSGPEWSCIFNPPHHTHPCLLQYCLTLRRLNQQSIAVKIRSPFKDNNVNTNYPCDFFSFFHGGKQWWVALLYFAAAHTETSPFSPCLTPGSPDFPICRVQSILNWQFHGAFRAQLQSHCCNKWKSLEKCETAQFLDTQVSLAPTPVSPSV